MPPMSPPSLMSMDLRCLPPTFFKFGLFSNPNREFQSCPVDGLFGRGLLVRSVFAPAPLHRPFFFNDAIIQEDTHTSLGQFNDKKKGFVFSSYIEHEVITDSQMLRKCHVKWVVLSSWRNNQPRCYLASS